MAFVRKGHAREWIVSGLPVRQSMHFQAWPVVRHLMGGFLACSVGPEMAPSNSKTDQKTTYDAFKVSHIVQAGGPQTECQFRARQLAR